MSLSLAPQFRQQPITAILRLTTGNTAVDDPAGGGGTLYDGPTGSGSGRTEVTGADFSAAEALTEPIVVRVWKKDTSGSTVYRLIAEITLGPAGTPSATVRTAKGQWKAASADGENGSEWLSSTQSITFTVSSSKKVDVRVHGWTYF